MNPQASLDDPLSVRLAALLAAAGSLPVAALAKRLNEPASVVLRELAALMESADPAVVWEAGSEAQPLMNRRVTLSRSGHLLREAAATTWPVQQVWLAQRYEAAAPEGEHLRADAVSLLAEVPVGFIVSGQSLAVMMATPADLEDLAFGLLFAEGVIEGADELLGVEVQEQADGVNLYLTVSDAANVRAEAMQRLVLGPSGCGLCGTRNLATAKRPLKQLASPLRWPPERLLACAAQLHGPLGEATGAAHAAALFDDAGALIALREDVGRHNALDKAIGAALRAGHRGALAIVTSRASFELAQKCMQAEIPQLATVSAPTTGAVDLARECGLALSGFLREGRVTRYV